MKITVNQLRKIIAEEVSVLSEAVDFGTALSAGSLAGVGRGSIVAALSALSDADFKKLELAMRDAGFAREDAKSSGRVSAGAGKMSPASLSKKIKSSLSSYNWSWAGEYDSEERDVIHAVLNSAVGPGTSEKFDEALMFYDADPTKSDVFRKMSPSAAKSKQASAGNKLQQIADMLLNA